PPPGRKSSRRAGGPPLSPHRACPPPRKEVRDMAGDWLKVEKDTPEKPEVLTVAAVLGLDPEVVFTKCFKLWRWFDSNTADGNARGVTAELLDSLVHRPGFSQALLDVGWLQARSGSLAIPHFDRHMGQSGKRRALTAERVARHKAKGGNA